MKTKGKAGGKHVIGLGGRERDWRRTGGGQVKITSYKSYGGVSL